MPDEEENLSPALPRTEDEPGLEPMLPFRGKPGDLATVARHLVYDRRSKRGGQAYRKTTGNMIFAGWIVRLVRVKPPGSYSKNLSSSEWMFLCDRWNEWDQVWMRLERWINGSLLLPFSGPLPPKPDPSTQSAYD